VTKPFESKYLWVTLPSYLSILARKVAFPVAEIIRQFLFVNIQRGTLLNLTSQITGVKKQSDERASLFDVRVNLPCQAILSQYAMKKIDSTIILCCKIKVNYVAFC
jgi:hypothetical protein